MVVKLGSLGGGGKKNIIIPRGLTQKHATTKKYVKNLECFFFVITAKNIYQNGLVSRVDIGYIGREKEEEEEEEEEEKSWLFCHFFYIARG